MTKHERAIEGAMRSLPDQSLITVATMEAAVAEYLAVMAEPAEDEVRVRVCVGVNEHGYWQAAGEIERPDSVLAAEVSDDEGGTQCRWVEATVPAWHPAVEDECEGEREG